MQHARNRGNLKNERKWIMNLNFLQKLEIFWRFYDLALRGMKIEIAGKGLKLLKIFLVYHQKPEHSRFKFYFAHLL